MFNSYFKSTASLGGVAITYQTIKVYYLTGTGNSYRVACWMIEAAEQYGIEGKVVAVEAMKPQAEIHTGSRLIGVVFPVHGFTAPWHVIRFVLSLPRQNEVHAVVAVTRGASKVGGSPVFPGMEGTAGYLIALILALKGYAVHGVTGIDMPSNWMSLHSSLSPANIESVLHKGKEQTAKFTSRILSGKYFFNSLVCLLLGLILLPISILYLALGRFWLSKLFFASTDCTGCGICVRNCPIGAVVIRGGKKPRPYWTFSCESCMRCMGYCPEKAVEVSHSLGAVFYYLTTVPAGVWLLNHTAGLISGIAWIQEGWASYLVQYFYMLCSLWLSYLVFHRLSQVTWINRLFTWTTLTHWHDRYHEPRVKSGNFKRR